MSWQTCPQGVTQEVPGEGVGEACSILLGQSNGDAGGQSIEVYAVTPDGACFIGTFLVSARAVSPFGTRVAAFACLPGVLEWRAVVQSPAVPSPSMPLKVSIVCSRGSGFSALTLVSP